MPVYHKALHPDRELAILVLVPEWRNGRRRGLKILWLMAVRVQVPPSAPRRSKVRFAHKRESLAGPRFFAPLPCSSFSARACGLWRGGTGVKQSPLCSQAGVPCRVPLFCIAPLLLLVRQTLKALADKETGNKECLFFTAAIAAGAGGNTFTSPFSCRRLPKSAPGKAGRSVSPLAGNFGQRLQLPLRPCQISRPQKTCPPGH